MLCICWVKRSWASRSVHVLESIWHVRRWTGTRCWCSLYPAHPLEWQLSRESQVYLVRPVIDLETYIWQLLCLSIGYILRLFAKYNHFKRETSGHAVLEVSFHPQENTLSLETKPVCDLKGADDPKIELSLRVSDKFVMNSRREDCLEEVGSFRCKESHFGVRDKVGRCVRQERLKSEVEDDCDDVASKVFVSQSRDNIVHVNTLLGTCLPFAAYVDTACAKCVVGQQNAGGLIDFCKSVSWPYRVVEDHEPFRFGPGPRIWSQKALIVVVRWGQQVILIRFSIVKQHVPFLVSKYVCRRLGAVVDLDANVLMLKRVGQVQEKCTILTLDMLALNW